MEALRYRVTKMTGDIVGLNGDRLSSPTEQDRVANVMRVAEGYAKEVAALIDREIQLFMEHQYPDGYTPEQLNELGLEEVHSLSLIHI